jgi:hypothetical protein
MLADKDERSSERLIDANLEVSRQSENHTDKEARYCLIVAT